MTKPAMLTAGLLIVGLGALFTAGVVAQTQPSAAVGDRPGVVIAARATVAATVEDVDRSQRLVTLKGPRGNIVTLKVSDEVRNFDQINVGDVVQADYLDAVAIVVRPAGTPAGTGEATAVGVAPPGGQPAATVVETKQITATVEAIDYDKRAVTLRGPRGDTRTVTVDPSVQRLHEVKVGDQVIVRHTEALALVVKKGS